MAALRNPALDSDEPSTSLGTEEKGELNYAEQSNSPSTGTYSTKEEPGEQFSSPDVSTEIRTVHGWKWAAAAASLYVGALIYGLDGTIAADIQSSIIKEFDSVEKLTWIGTAFPLGSVCAILPGATLYTMFNLKPLFIGSIILFEAASALCGGAPNMDALIVGRAIAGVGGTGIFLGILNYLTLCTTEKERGHYISGIGVVWGLGAVLGPVIGGAFATSSATWRWAFYINLVIAAVCAPAYLFYLPSVTPHGATGVPILKRLTAVDWLGTLLSMGFAVSLTLVLTFGGANWAWDDGRTIATFVVVGVLFILTFIQQRFSLLTTPEARMFPPRHILLDKQQILLCINTAMGATNIYVPVYYIPLYFSLTQGDSEIMAAVRLLPYICFLAVLNMFSGSLLPRVNYYWTLYLVGGILIVIGGATLFTVDQDTAMANVYGYSIIIGAGTGLVFNLGFTVAGVTIMNKTGNGLDVQRVISMQNLSQLGFQTLSLLIGGQMFQELSVRNLSVILGPLGFDSGEIRNAVAGTRSTLFATLTPVVQKEAAAAITHALSRVYALSIVTGGITVICALLMKKEKLFKTAGEKMGVAEGA